MACRRKHNLFVTLKHFQVINPFMFTHFKVCPNSDCMRVVQADGRWLTVMDMTRPCPKSTSSETILCRASGASGGADEYLSGLRDNTTDSFSSPVLTG